MKDNLKIVSSKKFERYESMYKIVDFLNKNLSNTGIIVGLSEKEGEQKITIYSEE